MSLGTTQTAYLAETPMLRVRCMDGTIESIGVGGRGRARHHAGCRDATRFRGLRQKWLRPEPARPIVTWSLVWDLMVLYRGCPDAARQSWRHADDGYSTEMDDMQMRGRDFRVEIDVVAAADSAAV